MENLLAIKLEPFSNESILGNTFGDKLRNLDIKVSQHFCELSGIYVIAVQDFVKKITIDQNYENNNYIESLSWHCFDVDIDCDMVKYYLVIFIPLSFFFSTHIIAHVLKCLKYVLLFYFKS